MNDQTLNLLFALGRPLGPVYAQLMQARAYFYSKNIFRQQTLAVPVISVGNLTMGGTGKTPLVIYIAELLLRHGYRPAVVSRGYRGKAGRPVNLVSDGEKILLSPQEAGDEPWLIAHRVPGIVVATGKKRLQPCRAAIESFGCDIIILDDGFQHLAVARTLDLVLFDTIFFAGNSRVFPGGDLREPVSALRRSNAFVLTGVTDKNRERADKCSELLMKRFDGTPVIQIGRRYQTAHQYTLAASGPTVKTIALDGLPKNLVAFCGIAHPERFRQSLQDHGISLAAFRSFADHYGYTERDVTLLCRQVQETNGPGLLTTEKDITKLLSFSFDVPLYTIPLHVAGNTALDNLIIDRIKQ